MLADPLGEPPDRRQRRSPSPVEGRVPSLADKVGFLYSHERITTLLAQARLAEVASEFRAQITTTLAVALAPTPERVEQMGLWRILPRFARTNQRAGRRA